MADYVDLRGRSVKARLEPFEDWYAARVEAGFWPYNKTANAAPLGETIVEEECGRLSSGFNFASQDYLSLSSHPLLKQAARAVIDDCGVHSAGSPALMGNTLQSRGLEARIAAILGYAHCLVYPTGWAAGFGVLRGLVGRHDHVVIDLLAHNCLQEGASFATQKVTRFLHNNISHLRRTLGRIRRDDPDNAIFVVTESLFSMDSDSPDLAAVLEAARAHDAILVVDVAHDFGILGPSGRSSIETFGLLGEVDVVMGSFSKVFGSNGGFVCTNSRAVARYLRVNSSSHLFSNAISPVQAASVGAAMSIAFSDEGAERRVRLFEAIDAVRQTLQSSGLTVLGSPSPIVPVAVGSEHEARLTNRLCSDAGVLTNLAEYPVVARGQARFRLQIQADHDPDEARRAADVIVRSRRLAIERLAQPAYFSMSSSEMSSFE